ncbi:MAG: PTS sugar transporter subunit IIB [Brevinema sp.]
MKVLVSCVSGMGSSQMIKMKINKVFTKLGLTATIDHLSIGEAKSVANNYDVIFCSLVLVENFKVKDTTKVIGLKNLLSEVEIEEAIRTHHLI